MFGVYLKMRPFSLKKKKKKRGEEKHDLGEVTFQQTSKYGFLIFFLLCMVRS